MPKKWLLFGLLVLASSKVTAADTWQPVPGIIKINRNHYQQLLAQPRRAVGRCLPRLRQENFNRHILLKNK